MKKTEAKEIAKSETKKEKADRRKQYWKDWRQERKIDQEQNDGGYDDVYEEMDMSKANFLVSKVSKLSTGARVFRGPLSHEILVFI